MINLSFDELRLIAQIRNISGYEHKSKENLIKVLSEPKPETPKPKPETLKLKPETPKLKPETPKAETKPKPKPKPKPEPEPKIRVKTNNKKFKKLLMN